MKNYKSIIIEKILEEMGKDHWWIKLKRWYRLKIWILRCFIFNNLTK